MRTSGSRRWCPTPQQLMILDHLYIRGLKTPTASQIQKITAHLSLYGEVQGKNVFYWFQNHKARDRHKLRLHYHRLLHNPHPPPPFLLFQGCSGGVREEEVPQANLLRSDYHPTIKDCSMRTRLTTNGRDSASSSSSMTMQEVGPTNPCCKRSHHQQPLQTLELFPLTASSDHHQNRPSP